MDYRKITDLDREIDRVLNEMLLQYHQYTYALRYGKCKGMPAAHWKKMVEQLELQLIAIRSEQDRRAI